MNHRILYLILVAMATISLVSAALPSLSPTAREDKAAVVMTGRVIGSRLLSVRKPGSTVLLVRLVAEVESIEKGASLIEGSRPLEIRCRKLVDPHISGPVGHELIPAEGSRFRAWLVQNPELQWEPLEPNGIELLEGAAEMDFTAIVQARPMRSFVIGAFAGIASLIAFALFLFRRRAIR